MLLLHMTVDVADAIARTHPRSEVGSMFISGFAVCKALHEELQASFAPLTAPWVSPDRALPESGKVICRYSCQTYDWSHLPHASGSLWCNGGRTAKR